MVLVYFTNKEWIRNEFVLEPRHRHGCGNPAEPYIRNKAASCPPVDDEFNIFKKIEMYYFINFCHELEKHGDVERAIDEAKFYTQVYEFITLTVPQYRVFTSLMVIYGNALIESINKHGSQCLEVNRKDSLEACRLSIEWSTFKKLKSVKCKIDGVEHKGKLGAAFDLAELDKQEKWHQKKQMSFHFLRKLFLSAVLLLLVSFSCHFLWNAPVETAVLELFNVYPTQTLTDLSFEDFNSESTIPTTNNVALVAPIHKPTNTPSLSVNSSNTVETSSILPYDNFMMPQEAHDTEEDLEMQLEKMCIQLVSRQDERDAAQGAQVKQALFSVMLASQANRFEQEMALIRRALEDQQAALANLAALLDQERTERTRETAALLQALEESKASKCQEDHAKALEEFRNAPETRVTSVPPTIVSTGNLDRFTDQSVDSSMPDDDSSMPDDFHGTSTCANNVSLASVEPELVTSTTPAALSLAKPDHLVGQPNVTGIATISSIIKLPSIPAKAVENATATSSDFVPLPSEIEEKQDSPAKSHPCPNSDNIVDYAKRAFVQFGVLMEEFDDYLDEQQDDNCRQLSGWMSPWYCQKPRAPRSRYFTAISIQCSVKSFYVPI